MNNVQADSGSDSRHFVLLSDQPIGDPKDDLLNMREISVGISEILVSSRAAAPFVLAVDAGWGMGKSTLLRQIDLRLSLEKEITVVWFNAWTAEGENALEGLIKSVLEELDSNVVRRWARKAARRQRLLGVAWIAFAIVCRFFGVARLVDEIWTQLAVDAKSRNELRRAIQDMLAQWVKRGDSPTAGRCMVVFVDDLDRCADEVVLKVCEAIKLYLDAPGIIFVLACDQSVLARGVSARARGAIAEGRSYLEKIVQIAYHIHPPDEDGIRKLIRGYADKSKTGSIIDAQVEQILAERTGRNPRKIKRIINSFILEYQLDPDWRKPPLSGRYLVTAILLQHLYAPFYDLLIHGESGKDLIGEFLEYAEIREKISDQPHDPQGAISRTMERVFQARGLPWPLDSNENLDEAVKRLEKKLPKEFPKLAEEGGLTALLRGLGDKDARRALTAQLFRRPLATEAPQQERFDWKTPDVDAAIASALYARELGNSHEYRRLREEAIAKVWYSPDLTPVQRRQAAMTLKEELDSLDNPYDSPQ